MKVFAGTLAVVGIAVGLFAAIRSQAPPPPQTWNREYQEKSTEYLKAQHANPIVRSSSCQSMGAAAYQCSRVSRRRATRAREWSWSIKCWILELSVRSRKGAGEDETYLHSTPRAICKANGSAVGPGTARTGKEDLQSWGRELRRMRDDHGSVWPSDWPDTSG